MEVRIHEKDQIHSPCTDASPTHRVRPVTKRPKRTTVRSPKHHLRQSAKRRKTKFQTTFLTLTLKDTNSA